MPMSRRSNLALIIRLRVISHSLSLASPKADWTEHGNHLRSDCWYHRRAGVSPTHHLGYDRLRPQLYYATHN